MSTSEEALQTIMTLTKPKSFLADKWPLLLSWLICIGLLIYAYGCEPQTKSLLDPNRSVNRNTFQLEFETLAKRFEFGVDNLDRQVKIRNFILNQTLTSVQSGSVNPITIVTSILSILGIGAIADDVKVRKKLKNATNKSDSA